MKEKLGNYEEKDMLYRPLKERLWDTWIVNEKSKYYLFYIRVSEKGTRWDGISLAISNDLIHWEEYGTVLKKDEDAIWLGTGMVQKVENKYIMNYSQEKPAGQQKIFFAESQDLLHWRKVPNIFLEPDGDIYLRNNESIADSYPRWDSLGIVNALRENNKPPYYAFLTSDSAKFTLPQKRGVLGCCTSIDGLNWKRLEPATIRKDIVPAFEVPEHIEINNHHYVIFCTSSKLGFRFDEYAKYLSGGTYYVHSDNLLGPYDFPKSDPMLVGSRDVNNVTMGSVGRVIYLNNKVIFYHIWGDPIADGWVGPVKELVELKKGELQLKYWNGNENLINRNMLHKAYEMNWKQSKKIGEQYPVDWDIRDQWISFQNKGSSGMILTDLFDFPPNKSSYSDGRVVECSFSEIKGLGAGIVLQTQSKENICIFFNKKDESIDFTKVTDGFCSNLVLQGIMSRKHSEINKEILNVRIMFRLYFIEVYINDVYISALRLTETLSDKVLGLYAEDSSGIIQNLTIYQMK